MISGNRGAGTVFFSGCSLRCVFCQNFEISHGGFGKRVSVKRLREIYFELIAQGAQNIDLVNPTHFTRAILESLEGGLPVPVVWNSGGYDRVETIPRAGRQGPGVFAGFEIHFAAFGKALFERGGLFSGRGKSNS